MPMREREIWFKINLLFFLPLLSLLITAGMVQEPREEVVQYQGQIP
jgi:hypothetical protein